MADCSPAPLPTERFQNYSRCLFSPHLVISSVPLFLDPSLPSGLPSILPSTCRIIFSRKSSRCIFSSAMLGWPATEAPPLQSATLWPLQVSEGFQTAPFLYGSVCISIYDSLYPSWIFYPFQSKDISTLLKVVLHRATGPAPSSTCWWLFAHTPPMGPLLLPHATGSTVAYVVSSSGSCIWHSFLCSFNSTLLLNI